MRNKSKELMGMDDFVSKRELGDALDFWDFYN